MNITFTFEVPEGTNKEAFVEAVTVLIHEGEGNLTEEQRDLIDDVIDITEKQ